MSDDSWVPTSGSPPCWWWGYHSLKTGSKWAAIFPLANNQLGCRHEPELPFMYYLHPKEEEGLTQTNMNLFVERQQSSITNKYFFLAVNSFPPLYASWCCLLALALHHSHLSLFCRFIFILSNFLSRTRTFHASRNNDIISKYFPNQPIKLQVNKAKQTRFVDG